MQIIVRDWKVYKEIDKKELTKEEMLEVIEEMQKVQEKREEGNWYWTETTRWTKIRTDEIFKYNNDLILCSNVE